MQFLTGANRYHAFLSAILVTAIPALPAELMPRAQQNALVKKYCAVCHTDAAKSGGLSLEHYDAAYNDPALAAMLLSKLQSGAMGAAGIGIPEKPTHDAWVAATTAQAAKAKDWTVTRTASALTASIVRDVPPRIRDAAAPLYRLTLTCDTASHQGETRMSWSPQPQKSRTFFVTADGSARIPQKLGAGEEGMGDGSAGLAAMNLHASLPERTLVITDLFPGETVLFPIGDLDPDVRRQLAVCLP